MKELKFEYGEKQARAKGRMACILGGSSSVEFLFENMLARLTTYGFIQNQDLPYLWAFSNED